MVHLGSPNHKWLKKHNNLTYNVLSTISGRRTVRSRHISRSLNVTSQKISWVFVHFAQVGILEKGKTTSLGSLYWVHQEKVDYYLANREELCGKKR